MHFTEPLGWWEITQFCMFSWLIGDCRSSNNLFPFDVPNKARFLWMLSSRRTELHACDGNIVHELLGNTLLWPLCFFSVILLMHFSPRGQREVRKKHTSLLSSPLPAFGSISAAPLPSSQPLLSFRSLNLLWSPRCTLPRGAGDPTVQTLPVSPLSLASFILSLNPPIHTQTLCLSLFHTCLYACLPFSLALLCLLSGDEAYQMEVFCWSLSLSALVPSLCLLSRKPTVQKYMGGK